ncbi:hypothetical protein [Streptomyces sp. NPDC021562]|uniref:hypothetical protein n=1 Tax=Streptomyces sp. NPDC021562 TaxID=3155121 RepID=UPI0010511DD4
MKKLAHRIGIATASLAVATGALFTAGGSASAAAFPADMPTVAQGVVAETGATGWNHGGYDGVRSEGYRHHGSPSDRHHGCHTYDRFDRFYPWVRDQLHLFDRFYPWVWDQLTELAHVT